MTASNQSYGPQYYKRGSIEVWDFIRDQSLNYHLGNVIKYICRAGYKDDPVEDLKKAIHYLTNELEHVKRTNLSRQTRDLSDKSSKGVPFDVSNWKFNQSGEPEQTEGSDS